MATKAISRAPFPLCSLLRPSGSDPTAAPMTHRTFRTGWADCLTGLAMPGVLTGVVTRLALAGRTAAIFAFLCCAVACRGSRAVEKGL